MNFKHLLKSMGRALLWLGAATFGLYLAGIFIVFMMKQKYENVILFYTYIVVIYTILTIGFYRYKK